jgi:DNA topoisomerase III
MKVCIAEKPSVAKEIASIIGAKNRKDGFFEGNGYQVTWTFGHLCTLKEPHEYEDRWKWWNIDTLPILPQNFDVKLISNKGVEKQFGIIKQLVGSATEIINCGDAGQEGELIQRWVLKLAKNDKPVKRLWISSLTEEAIKEGFLKLKDSSNFDRLFHAGSSRAIGDWLLGINATRLYTVKYGTHKQLLSIGRVQTPTLALIVNRHLEIENFRPQTYWEIKTLYRNVLFSSEFGKIVTKEEADKRIQSIGENPFIIVSVEKKKGKEAPPRLFDLTSLQVDCNKRYGFSADDTLKSVQSLYEKKFVSYPRVDTTYLPDDVYPKVPGILKGMQAYGNLTSALLGKTIKKTKKIFDNSKITDHHAIIPTGVSTGVLPEKEEKVYDMIARRFISAFYPDCEFSTTTVKGSANETAFKATGKQILDPGWRTVYGMDQISEEEKGEDQIMPAFTEGESGPHEPQVFEKQTQPPKPYSEATLLRAMETAGKTIDDEELREVMKDNGIGRPSTRAAIIETLFKRNYIIKQRKNLLPTQTGIQLIKTINNDMLKSAELTGQWEFKLRQIEKGNYEASEFLKEMKLMVSELVVQVRKEQPGRMHVPPKENIKPLCPKCKKGNVIRGKAAYGCNNFKECDFRIPYSIEDVRVDDQIALSLLQHKKALVKDASGNPCNIIINATNEISLQREKLPAKDQDAILCPLCKKGNIIEGKAAYGCSSWKSGCVFLVPFLFMGKKITLVQVKELSSKGETKSLKGFKSPEGNAINGKLKLVEGGSLVII